MEEGKAVLSRKENADTLPRSPLPLPHTSWQVGRSFVVCSPHMAHQVAAMNGCHLDDGHQGQQQTHVPITGPILVAQHGHTDAKE